MNRFSLELKENYQKPLIKFTDWYDFDGLLDTGALFPVWTTDGDILEDLGAKFVKADEPYHIILSATMMQNLIYTIDDKNHRMTVEIPEDESLERHMRIYDSGGKLHVLCGNVV